MVAKQNKLRTKQTLCTQISYLIIFMTQNILVIFQMLVMRQYLTDTIQMNEIQDKSFLYVSLNGAIMQPFFLH